MGVVGESELGAGQAGSLRYHVGAGLDRDEAVFSVPAVVPATVLGEVAIGVVGEGLGRGGDEGLAGLAADELGGGGRALEGGGAHGELEILRRAGAVEREFVVEPVADTIRGGFTIDLHGRGRGGGAEHGDAGRGAAAEVLVAGVDGVDGLQAVLGGGEAVADVVKLVAVGVAGARGGVGVALGGGNDLAESVVSIIPISAVLAGGADALVGGVVIVGRRGDTGGGYGGDATELVEGGGAGAAGGAGGGEGEAFGVTAGGVVALGGDAGALGDRAQAGGGVVGIRNLGAET